MAPSLLLDRIDGGPAVIYFLSAKVTVALHCGFVAFVFLGGYLLVSHRWLVWVHLMSLGYAFLITVVGWTCPLTTLEQFFLERSGSPVYSGEFLPHYVWSRFGLTGSEVPVAVGLIVVLVAANLRPYRAFLRAAPEVPPASYRE